VEVTVPSNISRLVTGFWLMFCAALTVPVDHAVLESLPSGRPNRVPNTSSGGVPAAGPNGDKSVAATGIRFSASYSK
jgi:hypothetical protein